MSRFDLVIPTVGRPSLAALLDRLDVDDGAEPATVVVIDDRPPGQAPLVVRPVRGVVPAVVRTGGRGPAAARNAGARVGRSPWICFLDDDVLPRPGWSAALVDDLDAAAHDVVAIQGRVHVPLPTDRPALDRERSVHGLETAAWITADMAVRRVAFEAVGGFDERFTRAYREDTDLALRLGAHGRLTVGARRVDHPVRPTSWWACVRAQRGNADDARMRRLHGRTWRDRGGAPRGHLRRHLLATAVAAAALGLAAWRPLRRAAALPALLWSALWVRSWHERRAGHRATSAESLGLAVTSAVIPFAATWWAAAGTARSAVLRPWPPGSRGAGAPRGARTNGGSMTTAREIMNADPKWLTKDLTVADAAERMASDDLGAFPVCDGDGHLEGMVTDRDIVVKVIAAGKDPSQVTLGELADQPEVVTIGADDSVEEAIRTMKDHGVRRLPVIDGTDLVGTVSQADIARNFPDGRVGDLVGDISDQPANN
ncbi:CBS domain-containing protein [Dermatobacter hominis]|uniref:CBS domain-containing protein n=1 Tax=Dermatobacter hominis TaxID=2884263 RepID=UPI002714D6BA|nr:CBS domain-containing protein [Dermatobacter hominis]